MMVEFIKEVFSKVPAGLTGARTLTINIVFFGLLAVVGWLFFAELRHPTTILEPISVPKSFADNGLTPEVVSHRLWESISKIEERAASVNEDSRFQTLSRQIDIVEPGTGLSVQGLAQIFRRLFGFYQTRVSGEIACAWENGNCASYRFHLKLRVVREDSVEVIPTRLLTDWNTAFREAAIDVLRITNPYVLAVYFDKSGRQEDALQTARGIIRDGHPDRDWAYSLLGYLENQQKQYGEAIRYLNAAFLLARDKSDTAMATVALNLGEVYLRATRADTGLRGTERLAAAIDYFEQANALRRDNIDALLAISEAYAQRADYDIADWYARKAMATDPDNPAGALQLASVHIQRGLVSNADKIYASLRARHPVNEEVILRSFEHLAERSGPDAAIEFLERESARLHDDLDLLRTLLTVHIQTGSLDKANADFGRLVDLLHQTNRVDAVRVQWLSLLVGLMNAERPLACRRSDKIMRGYEQRFGALGSTENYEATAKSLLDQCVPA